MAPQPPSAEVLVPDADGRVLHPELEGVEDFEPTAPEAATETFIPDASAVDLVPGIESVEEVP